MSTKAQAWLWAWGLSVRHTLRRRYYRVLSVGFVLTFGWWAWAVPGALGHSEGVAGPGAWPRWLVYAGLLVGLLSHPSARSPLGNERRPRLASAWTLDLLSAALLLLLTGEALLLASAIASPAKFHVEPSMLLVNSLMTVWGSGLVLSARILAPWPATRVATFLPLALLAELLLQRTSGVAVQVSAGLALGGSSIAILLDQNWRLSCASRS